MKAFSLLPSKKPLVFLVLSRIALWLQPRQRAAAARYFIENKFDGMVAQELARALKDFPHRKGDKGWESFDYILPGDFLSFMYYRHRGEHKNTPEKRTVALKQTLNVAETEKAKGMIFQELHRKEKMAAHAPCMHA